MTERFHHTERRFLIPEMFREQVESELAKILSEGRTYHVDTTYVDTPERSWSLMSDYSLPKMRVRTYNGKESFYEKKLHTESDTEKERVAVKEIPHGLNPVGETSYDRTEHGLGGVRITVDRNVFVDGKPFGLLIVEAKGTLPKELAFLKHFEDKKFSKYKLLSGRWKE